MKDYNLTLVTPPTIEPITPDEAVTYLKIDEADGYVTDVIKAAREYCEDFQHRAYITQTWELSLQEFPRCENDRLSNYQQTDTIEIPKGCLQSVDSFKYTDYAGTERTLTENVNYVVTKRGVLGRISPPYSVIWPPDPLAPLDPVVITFTCGYGDKATDVPLKVKQAMYMLISYWYDNRPPTSSNLPVELERAVKSLLNMDRIAVI